MERLVLVVVLAAVAVAIAWVLQRRRPDAPTSPARHAAPTQLDRADFPRPDVDWLIVVFSSATCDSCQGVWNAVTPLESDAVAVVDVEVAEQKALHDRYAIDAVPTTVVAGADGAVRLAFLGPVVATELWAEVAALRGDDDSADSGDGSDPPGSAD